MVVAIGLGIWHYHNRPSQVVIPVAPAQNTTTNNQSQGSSSNSTASTSSYKQTSSSGGNSASGGKDSGASGGPGPLTPSSGGLISNHHPGQGSPTTETSVCATTPGASCYIKFTKGNTTLQLQTGTADSNGTVYWNDWDISNYGFDSGQWTVTAVATFNGQTATATDATPLIAP